MHSHMMHIIGNSENIYRFYIIDNEISLLNILFDPSVKSTMNYPKG